MKVLELLWKRLTACNALDESGLYEKMFFERVYRHAFLVGLSFSDEGMWYKIYSAFVYGSSLTMIALQFWYVFSDSQNLDDLLSVVVVVMIHLITCWKLITMLVNKELYRKVAKALESPCFDTSTLKRRQLVEYWTKMHNKYLTILLYMADATLIFWNIYPLIDDFEYNLIISLHMPFKYNSTMRYIFTYSTIGIMFNIASYHSIMSEVIMQAYLLHQICQYAVLADCFENILEDCAVYFNDVDRDELIYDQQFIKVYKKRLGNLVDQHLMILKQTMDLKDILSAPLLGQLCGSGILICLAGYQATTTISMNPVKFMMSLGYLSYNMFTLYLNCRWCEEITSQSQNIGKAAYCSGWEQGISHISGVKATIIMVIRRANNPLIFVAGGMYKICLSSYTNLVKASYSALNILLRTSKE